MKKLFPLFFLLFGPFFAFSQQFMSVLPDSGIGEDFIEVRLFAADYSAKPYGQNLNFFYQSQNTGFVLSHPINLVGLNNIPNIGLGVEEDYGKHLLINFFNLTGGYIQNTWEITVSAGAGYSVPLNPKKTIRLRGTLNLIYENLSYGLGTYTDTTGLGFSINGVNIGTYVNNIKYVNSAFGVCPGLDMLFRGNSFSFFLSASYNYTLFYSEKIDFYRTKTDLDAAIYDQHDNPVSKGVIVPGNYILQLGIIKEFGL